MLTILHSSLRIFPKPKSDHVTPAANVPHLPHPSEDRGKDPAWSTASPQVHPPPPRTPAALSVLLALAHRWAHRLASSPTARAPFLGHFI